MTPTDPPDPRPADLAIHGLSPVDVDQQLDRIAASPQFKASRWLETVLRLIVEHTLAGDAQVLKERTIAMKAMGRPATFDGRLDSSVRVQVTRLRAALDRYYLGDGSADPIRIEIAAGGYRASFRPATDDAGLPGIRITTRAPLTSFVGRDVLLTTLGEALEGPGRLITLTGPGGSGKTRVALEALAARPAESVAAMVELAAISDPSDLSMAILNALGLAATSPGSSSDRTTNLTDRLVEVFRRQPLVLLLDNCEHLVDAVAVLAEELLQRAPSLTVLATSRESLSIPGELQLQVPPLALPSSDEFDEIATADAVQMFVDRATAVDPAFVLSPETAQSVATICRRLDGIPLALELAAARLRAFPVLALAAQLHDPLAMLDGGSRTAAQRQRTLRSMIDWSYRLLDENERLLFAACSVFVGGAQLDSIEFVAEGFGLRRRDVVGAVAGLVQKSLVIVTDTTSAAPRYSMLETVREFAAEALGDRRTEAADVQLGAAVALAATWGPLTRSRRQREALDRLDADHDNMRAALGHALAIGSTPAAAAIVSRLGWFWWARGHVTEARRWLREVIDRSDEPTADLANALAWACQLGFVQHDLEAAADLGRRAVAMHHALDSTDPDLLAEAQVLAANPLIRLGQLDEALAMLHAADARLSVTRDPWGLGSVRLVTGLALVAGGDLLAARQKFAEALAAYNAGDEGFGAVRTLFRLGDLDESVGDIASALLHCDEGLRLAEQFGLAESAAERTVERGRLLLALDQRDLALTTIDEGLAAARRLALPDTLARGNFAVGLATIATDRPAGRAAFGAAADRFEAASVHREASSALAALLADEEGVEASEMLLDRLSTCANRVQDPRVGALRDEAEGLVHARRGNLEAARRCVEAASAQRQRTGLPTPWWFAATVEALQARVRPGA